VTRVLHVSKELTFPPDFVTSTAVIYGGKGMGKTNLGSVIVEELARAQLRFAVLDAPGVWWGLRFDVSGKGPGIEVLILGGVHGDIPIEPTGGAVVADLVADEDASVVIDISRRPDGTMWSISERVRFVTDYCKRLYQRQGEKRRPVMQLIDEAARFIPQIVRQGEQQVAACMGAIAAMVEEGRNVGIGVTLITQRSARLNKDVAELADAMISFRTVGPNSRRAVLDWLGEHIEKKRIKDLDEKLRALPRGTALVVSPGWLEFEGVVHFRERHTFDSSATPKPGEAAKKVSGGAKPDLSKYAERMKETIERVAATDPRALQKKVAELQAQVKKLEVAKGPKEKVVTKEVVKVDPKLGALVKKLQKAVEQAMKFIVTINTEGFFKAGGEAVDKAQVQKAIEAAVANVTKMLEQKVEQRNRDIDKLRAEASKVLASLKALTLEDINVEVAVKHNEPFTVSPQRSAPPPRGAPLAAGDTKLNRGAREMLRALAAFNGRGLTRQELGVHAVLGYQTGTFSDYLSAMRRAGFIVDDGPKVGITAEGLAAAGGVQPARDWAELVSLWTRGKVGGGARRMLEALAHSRASTSREQLGEQAQLGHETGTFSDYLSLLRRNGLIEEGASRGEVKAADALFLSETAHG
jgi:hypothetical protein